MSKPMLLLAMILLLTANTVALQLQAAVSDSAKIIGKPNCTTQCGEVSIPYPFGIGDPERCYFDEWYEIECRNSTENYTPFLRLTNMEVLEISTSEGTLAVKNPIRFSNCKGKDYGREAANLTGSPFVYSQRRNRFTAVSCGNLALMNFETKVDYSRESRKQTVHAAACMSLCEKKTTNHSCNGMNCCQTTIPSDLVAFTTTFDTTYFYGDSVSCSYAFLVDQEWFESRSMRYDHIFSEMDSVPVVLEWSLLYSDSEVEVSGKFLDEMDKSKRLNSTSYCKIDNITSSIFNYTRIQCHCENGFEGNPYLLLHGCQDVNECENPPDECKDHTCLNLHGSYMCKKKNPTIKRVLLGISIVSGVIFLHFVLWFLYKVAKKRRKIQRKQKFFKLNGGLLLQQQLCSSEVNVDTVKLFNSKELQKATNRFHVDRILGHGGQGTVYKGMLTDGRIVAVKKSKIVDESKIAEFINEVVILSQVNHRNVVKLLGCCLETEVPLLVYEFIPNGTLSQYIHNQNEEFPLTWEMRLRIAIEIAGALSYLHSAASFPIYHRDIKSTNILLDEKYRAKIADFGTSRSISIEQTHITTLVHGTLGYLDPEYFQSNQFTEKSDVYSFGVVLLELLTGEKAISMRSEEVGRSLATHFIVSMQEGRLFDILDGHVLKGPKEGVMVVANLAKRCLNLNGRKRPTMKEVTMELEGIQMLGKATTSINVPQNHEEVECVRTQVIEPWDVTSISTGSAYDTGRDSSLHELPLLSFSS
nr:wall-associated receptor kinase-like 1 isoform X1 [Ziziphus jujuba var. spinosa]